MKKILALMMVMICTFCWSFVCAEGLDYASMSDEQLQAIIDAAKAELSNRNGGSVTDGVLIDQDGVKVYLTGEYEVWGYDSYYLDLEVIVENNSDKTVSILVESACVNGWTVYGGGVSDTGAGKKQKGVLDVCLTDAEISTYEEVEEIEFDLVIYDSENWETIANVDTITLTF